VVIEKLSGYHRSNSIEETAKAIYDRLSALGFGITKLTINIEHEFTKNTNYWKAEVICP